MLESGLFKSEFIAEVTVLRGSKIFLIFPVEVWFFSFLNHNWVQFWSDFAEKTGPLRGGGKHLYTKGRKGQTFYVEDVGGDEDIWGRRGCEQSEQVLGRS